MNDINKKSLISYSLLAFCLSFIGLPIYIYLPNYYHDNFDISLKTIALILFFTRLIDTIQDPIFGILSDKYFYLKRKIICFLAPVLGVAFCLLFFPLPDYNIKIWLVVFLIITYSLFSLIYINYQSCAISFSEDYHFKTKIIAYREVAFISGIIVAAAAPSILFQFFSEVKAFFFVGVFYAFLITFFALIFYYFAPKINHQKQETTRLFDIFKVSLLSKFFIIFLMNSIASAIPAVLILFFVEDILGAKDLAGLFLILYFVGLLFGAILWTKVSKILDNKVKAWLIAILLTALIFVWCYFLNQGDIIAYGLICILSGICFGGDFALGYSILTDIIQKNHLQNSQSTIIGVINFIIKISLTLASSILIYFIGVFEGDILVKKQFISFSYALFPIGFRIASGFILYRGFLCSKN